MSSDPVLSFSRNLSWENGQRGTHRALFEKCFYRFIDTVEMWKLNARTWREWIVSTWWTFMKILKIIEQYLGAKGDNHIIQFSKKQKQKRLKKLWKCGSNCGKRRKCAYNMYVQKNKMEMDWILWLINYFLGRLKCFKLSFYIYSVL